MEIVQEAKKDFRPWWVGRQVSCYRCGMVMKLTPDDAECMRDNSGYANFNCPGCKAALHIYNDSSD